MLWGIPSCCCCCCCCCCCPSYPATTCHASAATPSTFTPCLAVRGPPPVPSTQQPGQRSLPSDSRNQVRLLLPLALALLLLLLPPLCRTTLHRLRRRRARCVTHAARPCMWPGCAARLKLHVAWGPPHLALQPPVLLLPPAATLCPTWHTSPRASRWKAPFLSPQHAYRVTYTSTRNHPCRND